MLELYETYADEFLGKNGVINLESDLKLSNRQKRLLILASRLAETSELPQKHGAVIVKSGRVLAFGVNKWRNRDMVAAQTEYNPNLTYHAEVDALNRFQDVRGATVYIARVGKAGEMRFSRPCSRCLVALKEAGIKKVVYTTNDMKELA